MLSRSTRSSASARRSAPEFGGATASSIARTPRIDTEIICADVSFYVMHNGETLANTCNVAPVLHECGVRWVDGTQPPYRDAQVPGGGLMFGRYTMMEELHDAAEVCRTGTPTIMLFVQSLNGISHNKIEDTREEHLEMAVQALDRLATKTIHWIAGQER